MKKFDEETYDLFIDLFESMPVCALVNNKYFAVHGGISPDLVSVIELDKTLNRFQEPPTSGILCDMLWSDPVEDDDADFVKEYSFNNERDCSYLFGKAAAKKMLEKNGLVSILRGH